MLHRFRSNLQDPVLLLWWAFLALAIVISLKCLPGAMRIAREGSDLDPVDAASISAALGEVNLTLADFAYVQSAIALVLQGLAIGIAWLLLRAPSRNRFTILMAFVIAATTAATYPPGIPDLLPGQPVWQAITTVITIMAVVGLFTLPFFFPSGKLVGKWVIPVILFAFASQGIFKIIPEDQFNLPLVEIANIAIATIFLSSIIASLTIAYRRTQSERERLQFKWVAFGMIISIPAFFIGDFAMRHIGPGTLGILSLVVFTFLMPLAFFLPTLAIGIAILRYRLFDIDLLLSQTLIWLTLSTIVIAVYIAIVIGIGHVFGDGGQLILSIITTGLVALAF